jgi:hypothetical protein
MVKRFVAELPRKQILSAGSELSPRVLRKVFSPTLFPINLAVAQNVIARDQQCMSSRPKTRTPAQSEGPKRVSDRPNLELPRSDLDVLMTTLDVNALGSSSVWSVQVGSCHSGARTRRQQDGDSDVRDLRVEFGGNILEDEHQQEEVERIERQPRKLPVTTGFCSRV